MPLLLRQTGLHTQCIKSVLRSYAPSIVSAQTRAYATRTMSLDLKYDPARAEDLKANLDSVLAEIDEAAKGHDKKARLVPISKLKPASDIQALYDAGQRHFGENYIQEMVDKAEAVSVYLR